MRILLLLVVGLLLPFQIVSAGHRPVPGAADLVPQVSSFKLNNGMTWLVVRRPRVPVFSGVVMVRAGGVDEEPGKTGLAHMFEHMAFKGSKTIGTRNYAKEIPILEKIAQRGREMASEQTKEKPDGVKIAQLRQEIQKLTQEQYPYMVKNEVWQVLTRKGAEDLNAFTSKDVTAYHAGMLQSQFPLWAKFTSEMILDPVLREFYQERDVVMEERRLRYDNSPQGTLYEALVQEAFPEGPYHQAPIGSWKDLQSLTMEDAEAFHKKHYVPSNMVGVLVGAVTAEKARPHLEKTFGRFPARKKPSDAAYASFAFQGERRKTISFPAEPYLAIAFYKPKAPAHEDYVFDLLDMLLCEGRTGRLYKKLVKEERIAANVYCAGSFPGSRLDNLFVVLASPLKGHSPGEIEASIYRELENIGKGVHPEELEKVRLAVSYQYLWGLEDNLQFGEHLAMAQTVMKDWRYVTTYTKVINSIQGDEIAKTAQKYFVPENRVVIYRVRGKR